MKTALVIVIAFSAFTIVIPSPYDDGKYYPKKYRLDYSHDDGRYYRPPNEGKYIPGDEGRYTYIYRQFIDGDYRYLHREGPNGPNGGGADDYGTYAEKYGYVHQVGPNGPNGGTGSGDGYGPDGGWGPGGPNGPGGFGWEGRDEDWYCILDEAEGTENYYTKIRITEKLKSIVCSSIGDKSNILFIKKILGEQDISGERLVSQYKMKGSKKVVGDDLANGKNVTYKYEVIVSVIEEDDQTD